MGGEDNVISIAGRLPSIAVDDNTRLTVLDTYKLPDDFLLMGMAQQILMLKDTTFEDRENQQTRCFAIFTLLNIMEDVFRTTFFDYRQNGYISVRELLDTKGRKSYSLMATVSSSEKMFGNPEVKEPEIIFTLYVDELVFDEDLDLQGPESIYSESTMIFDEGGCGSKLPRMMKRIVKNMNDLVSANGGYGDFLDGGYMVRLPTGRRTLNYIYLSPATSIERVKKEETK